MIVTAAKPVTKVKQIMKKILGTSVLSLLLSCSIVGITSAGEDDAAKNEAKERAAAAIEAHENTDDPAERERLQRKIIETQIVVGGGNDTGQNEPPV